MRLITAMLVREVKVCAPSRRNLMSKRKTFLTGLTVAVALILLAADAFPQEQQKIFFKSAASIPPILPRTTEYVLWKCALPLLDVSLTSLLTAAATDP
jgi:hypothetical protein